jgi:large subunit ribosomal protein L25
LTTEAGTNALMRLRIESGDGTERLVMVREIQNDPIRGEILHADLLQISVDREVEVDVPIELEGIPIGVVQDQGYLGQLLSTVAVRCLPMAIPPSVNIDVSEMEVGAVIHVKDLQLPSGVEMITDSEEAVASVTVVTAGVEEEVLEGEAVEEGKEAPGEEEPGAAEAAKEESGEG